jgi:hypothetical protein
MSAHDNINYQLMLWSNKPELHDPGWFEGYVRLPTFIINKNYVSRANLRYELGVDELKHITKLTVAMLPEYQRNQGEIRK